VTVPVPPGLPPLVARAYQLARTLGFPLTREEAGPDRPSACLPGTGQFLGVLAAGCRGGRIGEIGTGAGIGTAWLAGAMPADCALVTADIDERLVAAVGGLMADDDRVDVLAGDAYQVLPRQGPFDLLFADGAWRDPTGWDSMVGLLRPGGRIVMDDVTPAGRLPADSPLRDHDAKREFFFAHPELTSAEVVLPDLRNSLLVGTRRG
jgi:predicted O-methyltransferase YrrM